MKKGEQTQIIQVNGVDIVVGRRLGTGGKEHQRLKNKLIPREELSHLGDFLRNRDLRISFTTGTYDMIHVGHVRYLELARSLGDVLLVGLNSDASVRALKGPSRPILEETKRAEMLSFLAAVDYITLFDELTGAEVIRKLRPHVYLCVEGSWEGDLATKEEVMAMSEHGGEVVHCPRQDPHLSTSALVKKIGDAKGLELVEQFRKLVQGE